MWIHLLRDDVEGWPFGFEANECIGFVVKQIRVEITVFLV